MILAEFRGRVTEMFQQPSEGRHLFADADRVVGQTHHMQTGSDRKLAGDERRSTRGAAGLGVIVGEAHAFRGDAVDIGRIAAHHAVVVAAQVRPTQVVGHDHQDIRFSGLLARRVLGEDWGRGSRPQRTQEDAPDQGGMSSNRGTTARSNLKNIEAPHVSASRGTINGELILMA